MHMRVVRFTDVTPERMQSLLDRIQAAGGPPAGVTTTGLRVLFDERQGTAVVLQEFASAADMEESAKVFEAMDSGETPGTRTSVDETEQRLELHP